MSTQCNEQPSTSDFVTSTSDTENGQESRSQAVFVNKLYSILEDDTVQHLISWSEKGDHFGVSNINNFSKVVLPRYFKHSNWQSFVRQLNMYGFHKVNDSIHTSTNPHDQNYEFKHPHFKRGDVEDLQNIKRKSSKSQITGIMRRLTSPLAPENASDEAMYKHILHIEENLEQVNNSCNALRNETNVLKNLVIKQQEVIGSFSGLIKNMLEQNVQKTSSNEKKEFVDANVNELQQLFESSFSKMESFVYEHCFSARSSSLKQNNTRSSKQTSETTKKFGFGKDSHILNPVTVENNDFEDTKRRRLEY